MKYKRRKIALVEDNQLFRKMMAELVESFTDDFTVALTASNGMDLLEKLEMLDSVHIPDIIFTDFDMPIMNGYETANYIQKYYPGVKVVAFSLRGDEQSIIKMIANGASGYLHKTFEPRELPIVLQAVINDHYYVSRNNPNFNEEIEANFLVKLPPVSDINLTWNAFNNKEKELVNLLCSPISDAEVARSAKLPNHKLHELKTSILDKLKVADRIAMTVLVQKYSLFSPPVYDFRLKSGLDGVNNAFV